MPASGLGRRFAVLYEQIGDQRVRPSCLYCGDDEAAALAEELIRDAGYDPISAGGLEQARALEDFLALIVAVRQTVGGQTYYRIAKPGEL